MIQHVSHSYLDLFRLHPLNPLMLIKSVNLMVPIKESLVNISFNIIEEYFSLSSFLNDTACIIKLSQRI